MRAEPQEKLDPRIKAVWRISDALLLSAVWACIALPAIVVQAASASDSFWWLPPCATSVGAMSCAPISWS